MDSPSCQQQIAKLKLLYIFSLYYKEYCKEKRRLMIVGTTIANDYNGGKIDVGD